jgi:copper chaperone CopZ
LPILLLHSTYEKSPKVKNRDFSHLAPSLPLVILIPTGKMPSRCIGIADCQSLLPLSVFPSGTEKTWKGCVVSGNDVSMVQEVTLTLPKIGCQGCVKKVVRVLGDVPTVEVVATDVPTKSVRLRYDESTVGMEQFAAALQTIGHVIATQEERV